MQYLAHLHDVMDVAQIALAQAQAQAKPAASATADTVGTGRRTWAELHAEVLTSTGLVALRG